MSAEPCFASRVRRVTASYRTLREANAGAALLVHRLRIEERRVQVIGVLQRPQADDAPGPQGEPAFWRRFAREHVRAGLAGLVCGFGLWVVSHAAGVAAVTASPAASALACALLGTLIGLAAGLLLLQRPGARLPPATAGAHAALDEGRWILTVRIASSEEERRILSLLAQSGGRTAVLTSARASGRAGC
jgi:hypothetical protein